MIVQLWRKFGNYENENSFAYKLRKKRFNIFIDFMNEGPNSKLLDVGGSQKYWDKIGFSQQDKHQITLLNINDTYLAKETKSNFINHVGDARDMKEFKDKDFDIVFSNSVIEHVGDFEEQKKMANEVIRVGKRYSIQTPSRYFPIEPHYMFPFFQFLPLTIKLFLHMHFDLGSVKKQPDKQKALKCVKSIRLLSFKDVKTLFPNAKIRKEKILFFTKSYTAIG